MNISRSSFLKRVLLFIAAIPLAGKLVARKEAALPLASENLKRLFHNRTNLARLMDESGEEWLMCKADFLDSFSANLPLVHRLKTSRVIDFDVPFPWQVNVVHAYAPLKDPTHTVCYRKV